MAMGVQHATPTPTRPHAQWQPITRPIAVWRVARPCTPRTISVNGDDFGAGKTMPYPNGTLSHTKACWARARRGHRGGRGHLSSEPGQAQAPANRVRVSRPLVQ